jgi:hypothetical protein
VGFVVDKVALGWVFSEYFGFPCQSSFHQILYHHNHPGQATIGQSVTAVPSGPSWTPPLIKRIKKPTNIRNNMRVKLTDYKEDQLGILCSTLLSTAYIISIVGAGVT